MTKAMFAKIVMPGVNRDTIVYSKKTASVAGGAVAFVVFICNRLAKCSSVMKPAPKSCSGLSGSMNDPVKHSAGMATKI